MAAIAVASIGIVNDASARPRAKAGAAEFGRIEEIPIPKFSSTVPNFSRREPTSTTEPMRFFTINGALAKFEGRPNESAKIRYAAVTPARNLIDAPSKSAGPEPFGMFSFRAPVGTLWNKWRKIQDALATEEPRLIDCLVNSDQCDPASRVMVRLILNATTLQGRERFALVAASVNGSIRYAGDYTQHGVIDLWTAPLATLEAGLGDCEDYAILKYQVLRQAGTPTADLKIVLLRDTATREDHAVLAARSEGRWFILDNRRAGFYTDDALPHYLPLFALNGDGVQLFAAPYAARQTAVSDDPVPSLDE